MDVENLEYLKKGLEITGFGNTMNGELEAKIKDQPKEFQLSMRGEYTREGKEPEKVDYKLDFRKSDMNERYFFNRYEAKLLNEDPAKEKSHTFYINKDWRVTAKEAFNLLSGRAVHKNMTTKDGDPYSAWIKLDFSAAKDKHNNFEIKQYTQGYGYDLLATLKKYPIREMEDSRSMTSLIEKLERGNLQAVTFVREGGKEEKMHIEANPQFKTLNLYDENLKKYYQANEKKEGQAGQEKGPDNIVGKSVEQGAEKANEKKTEKKESAKQEKAVEEGTQKKSKRKGVSV